jgi:peptide/nickel transport system ATP-binding protein
VGSAVRLLDVKGLQKFFPIRKGFLKREVGQVRAVDDVSFHVEKGETLSLVGESGCGKTTTARCILRALTPTAGQILFRTDDGSVLDVVTMHKGQLRPLRRQMQMIFQDPFSSLNPRRTLFDIVAEPLVANRMGTRQEQVDRVAELLRLVGLRPEYMRRYPHAFSGGQRQRIGIARALALSPSLVVADEPVSALDVSVQAQILNLMLSLQAHLGLTYLFVAHDLSVVKHVSDRVAVMYVGGSSKWRRHSGSSPRRSTRTPRRCSRRCRSRTRGCAPSASSWKGRLPTRRIRRRAAISTPAVGTRGTSAGPRLPASRKSSRATS